MNRSEGTGKTLKSLLWSAAAVPTASLLLFWSFVLRTRLALGRWPIPSNPDPKDLGFSLHYWAWFWGLFGLLIAAPLLVILVLVVWFRWPAQRRDLGFAVALYVGVLLVSIVLYRLDFGGFSEWMMD